MDGCGDITYPSLDDSNIQKDSHNIKKQTFTPNPNSIFQYDESYDYEIYNKNERSSFEEKVRSGKIIRSPKFTNKRVAVLRYKERQNRKNQKDEIVSKIIFILGAVGCLYCNTIEVGSAYAFFSQDFDMVLAKKRVQIENPSITDQNEINKIARSSKKRSGSSLKDHLKKCNPVVLDPDEKQEKKSDKEKPENKSGVKNGTQFKDKSTHILQTKTVAAMMIISSGIPMSFLENPYLPQFCDLTGALSVSFENK